MTKRKAPAPGARYFSFLPKLLAQSGRITRNRYAIKLLNDDNIEHVKEARHDLVSSATRGFGSRHHNRVVREIEHTANTTLEWLNGKKINDSYDFGPEESALRAAMLIQIAGDESLSLDGVNGDAEWFRDALEVSLNKRYGWQVPGKWLSVRFVELSGETQFKGWTTFGFELKDIV